MEIPEMILPPTLPISRHTRHIDGVHNHSRVVLQPLINGLYLLLIALLLFLTPSLSSSPPSPTEEDEGCGVELEDGDEGDGSW